MTVIGPVRHDHFQPRHEPARAFYDAIKKASSEWKGDSAHDLAKTIHLAIWGVARDYAQQRGLQVLTMEEIGLAEFAALGHVDYSAKFAYRVRDLLVEAKQEAAE